MFALRRAQPFALLQRRAFAAAPMVRARLSHAIFLGPALVESIQIDMPRTLCLKKFPDSDSRYACILAAPHPAVDRGWRQL